MKRIYYFLITAIIFITIITGCGKKKASDEVVMWLVGSEGQSQSVNELAKLFFNETGIKVRCEAISWGEAHSKYLTSIAGGVPPDIGTMGLTWGSEFGELGTMVDLMEEFKSEVRDIKKETFPGIWESVEYRGRVYGIPFDMTLHILYYRNDIINTPPATWEELVEALKSLKSRAKGMIFDWGSMEWIGFSPFLWQAGGDFYNQSYSASAVDSAEAVKGLEYFTNLYRVYGVPKTQIPLEQGMRTGDFPLCISGNWKIIGLTVGAPEISGKWSIATLPKGPSGKGTAFIGGRVMGIFRQSKNKEKAWQFIKFLFKPQSQAFLYEGSIKTQDAYLPPNIDSWDMLDMKQAFKEVLIAQAKDAKGPPPVLGWDATTRHIDEAIQKVILKNSDIPSVLKTLKILMDEELKKSSS